MEKNINIEKFMEDFNMEYDFLYDNNDNVEGYREVVQSFDEFIKVHGDFVGEFAKYRGDYISSDRECAAFMFAMEKYM